jgi:hypothetical protein
VPNKLTTSAKNLTGELEQFTSFKRRLVSVPHSEIEALLGVEKQAKRTPRASFIFRDSAASIERED